MLDCAVISRGHGVFRPRLWHVLLMMLVAFYPVLRWYVLRVTDSSDEPWGVIALITAAVFVAIKGRSFEVRSFNLRASAAFMFIYAVSFHFVPPLGRAVLAVLAIVSFISPAFRGRSMHTAIIGLLILSLPVIATLQFYLGYPLRFVSAVIAAKLIGLTGYNVAASGTSLLWAGEIISVDAPCAGIRMLWAALYLNFTLACFSDMGTLRTWLAYALTGAAVFAGNLIRVTALFFVESRIVSAPKWAHAATGITVFVLVCAFVFYIHKRLGRRI